MKPLHCIVCVKPVPDFSAHAVEFDRQTKTVKRENVPTIINPLDKNALEAALPNRSARVTSVGFGLGFWSSARSAVRRLEDQCRLTSVMLLPFHRRIFRPWRF